MADIDLLPPRGIPRLALVDGLGIATNGSQTVAQLAARGMRSVCAVDSTGVSVSGATMLQLAQRGIQAFCPVDELGVAQSGATADALRRAGIRPMVLLGATGVALTGSATMLTLAQRGLPYFCPVDEAGNATTMGAVILVSNTNVLETATIGTNVGVLSVAGGTGTYTFSLTDSAGGKFAVAGTNGVNLNTAATLNYATAPSHNITVSATNGGTPITRTIVITVVQVPVLPANAGGANLPAISGSTVVGGVLTSTTGTWTGSLPITYAYQWKRGATNVGTNSSTYTTVAADIGSTMTVVVTATNTAGSANATSAATAAITGIAPVNTVLPAISGSTTQGATLTATTGTWTGTPTPTYAYQWKSAGVNVGTGLTTYATVVGDVGNTITVVVTATNVAGSANATSAAFGPIVATAGPPGAPTLDLAAASDTGSSSTDDITTDTTPDIVITFTVALVTGDIIHLLDGASELVAHTVTALEAGSSTIELTAISPLAGGAHSLTATHERGGLTSPVSAALVFTVDLTAPTITTPSTANVNEGVALAIALTANETVTWTETLDTGNHFEISGATLRWTSNGTKAFTGVVDAYSCEVTATDVVGNASSATITVTVLDVAGLTRDFGAEGIGISVTTGSREWSAEGVSFVES